MTTYLGDKAVGIGTIKATKAVAGDVLHDETLVGNGNTEPLGVDKQVIATTNQVANLSAALHEEIDGKQDKLAPGDGIKIVDNVISATAAKAEWGKITGDLNNQKDLKDALDAKQDTLTAGDGISIEGNVISNTRTNAEWGNITGELSAQTDLQDALGAKQDKLTAGANIRIEDNVISSTAQESFFRGRYANWAEVPVNNESYLVNYRGERTPSYNDYIVVEDASTYVSDFDKTMTIIHDESTYRTIQVTENGVTTTYDLFINANTPAEIILGSGSVSIRADSAWFNGNINYTALRPVKVGNRYYEVGDKILSYNYYVTNSIDINYSTESNAYQGSWRFFYNGVWDTNGIEGWKPEYQIEEVMPIASDTQAGIAKLYTTSGTNTDGAMTQKAITENTTRVIIRRWN